MKNKWGIAVLMGAVLSWSVAGAAFAAPVENPHVVSLVQSVGAPPPAPESVLSLEPTVTETVQLSPGNAMIAKAIETVFGVDEDQVLEIHEQAHGWGQVFKVFLLAKLTEQSAEDILAMREDGMGWGQIFQDAGLKPGNGKNNLGGAVSGHTAPADSTTTTTNTSTTITTDSTGQTNQWNPNKGGGNPNAGKSNANDNGGKGNSHDNEGKGKGKGNK